MPGLTNMNLLIVTDDTLVRRPDGRFSARLASTRLRLLVAFNGFGDAGLTRWMATRSSSEHILSTDAFQQADIVLFGKTFTDHFETAQAARQRGKAVAVDISDDLDDRSDFSTLKRVASIADVAVFSSEGLKNLSARWVPPGCRCVCIEEPYEGGIQPIRVGFHSTPQLELLWFGTSRNIVHLVPHLSEIAELAEDQKIRVTLVCFENHIAQRLCAAAPDREEEMFKIRFLDWSLEAQAEAFRNADLVVIPGDLDMGSGLKSPNRLINTIAAGRLAVASPLPSYLPFSDHALVRDRMADGIRDALAMAPDALEQRIRGGQQMIAERYAEPVIGQQWVQAFALPARAL